MVFSSFLFLFLFFPSVSLAYLIAPRRWKNSVLLGASMMFYSWGAPQVLPLLAVACVFDFIVGSFIVPGRIAEKNRKLLFGIAVVTNLSALLYYKYFNFAAAEINRIFLLAGITPLSWSDVLLPIGISFFTFHKISYLGDVFRGKVLPSRSLVDYFLYILFFPQLIAGPIIRYADVADQFQGRRHSLAGVSEGLLRLCYGLGKKVLIADTLGVVVDRILVIDSHKLSAGPLWLAAVCYSFQIFFDFSGYSDMAIGLAKIFGFTFKENFDRPYRATTFTDFWKRWHISLTNFMREYVYIPLGGNRISSMRTHLNLWITFLLSGLWHGASWNFVIWGAYHGAFLTIDRLGWSGLAERLPRTISVALTFFFVTIGWIFFRADSLPHALDYLGIMFGAGDFEGIAVPRAYLIDNRGLAMLGIAVVLAFAPKPKISLRAIRDSVTFEGAWLATRAVGAIAALSLSCAALASRGYTPFLYFRF